MSFCPGCGNRVVEGVAFCNACGAPLIQQKMGDDAGMRMLLPVGRSGWAIAAGYAGLLGLLVFPAPLALLLGIAAVAHLKSNGELHGWGRAIFGLAVGVIGTAVLAVVLLGS